MASEILSAVTATMYYNNGTHSDGTVIEKPISLPTLNADNYDAAKVWNIINYYQDIVSLTYRRSATRKTYALTAS